jgi:hypothetical protein
MFRSGEGGFLVGRTNYSISETEHMLKSIGHYLHFSDVEWYSVVDCHSQVHPNLKRMDVELKKKFNKLSRTSAPTGDLTILPNLLEAQATRQLIIEENQGSDWI